MPVVTISRGSYFHGKAVAEKLARRLGYKNLSRDEVIENLEEFHLPEIKLVRGLNDAFSVLDRFPHGKQRFITAIRAELMKAFAQGKVVYNGLVGHHFVADIPHVLKVRIIADIQSRVEDEMSREDISEEQARYILRKDDEERRKWGMFLYGIDIEDAQRYNLILRIGHVTEDDAVDIIASAAQLPAFQETEESLAKMRDAALSAQVSRNLFDFPNASVSCSQGIAKIVLKVPESQQATISERVDEMLIPIEDLREYSLQFEPYY